MNLGESMFDVVYVTDHNYVIPTAVSISSLIAHNTTETYHIHIFGVDLVQDDMDVLQSVVISPHVATLIDCKNEIELILSDVKENCNKQYVVATAASLSKFLIPKHIVAVKALFIDGDTVITKDLSELIHVELDDKYVAAVRDLPQVLYKKQIIGAEIAGRDYFNSGVMVLNCAKMRHDKIPEKLIQYKREKSYSSGLMDQDVFNDVLKGNVVQLPIKYNTCILNLERSAKKYDLAQINDLYNTEYSTLNDLLNDAAIIHFSSKTKPWEYYDLSVSELWYRQYLNSKIKVDGPVRISLNDGKEKLQQLREITTNPSNQIPIVYCTDNNYAKYAAASIQSVISNSSPDNQYRIFVLHDEKLTKTNIDRLTRLSHNNVLVRCLDVSNIAARFGAKYSCSHYSIQMYYRWFIAEVLTQYDKIIYFYHSNKLILCFEKYINVKLNTSTFASSSKNLTVITSLPVKVCSKSAIWVPVR